MSKKNNSNIQVYHKRFHFNVGMVIFGVIFIYLLVTILAYLTSNRVTAYEVRDGSILKDQTYTGLIIRNEVVVNAEADGYINFFALEGSKVGAQSCVYTLSDNALNLGSNSTTDSESLTADQQNVIYSKIQSYNDNYNANRFSDVYSLKDNINNALSGQSSKSKQNQLADLSADSSVKTYNAATDGIVLYTVDGLEGVTADTVTEAMINKEGYQSTSLQDDTQVTAGTAIYKVVTDNNWSIAIVISQDTAKELADASSVKVQFPDTSEVFYATVELKNDGNTNIAILSFDNSMVQYATSRYADIELITTDESGLKIPESSVTEKTFYTVPVDYITQGGNSNSTGVLVDNGTDTAKFVSANIYYSDSESNMVYLSTDVIAKNATLKKADSTDTYTVSDTASLKGVYNINKGYAEFKPVTILCESDGYYIVESDSIYGIVNYDRIALQGSNVKEDDIVF